MVERAEIIRDKGTNRSQFFRGEVDKYTWVDVGSSYVPSELCCAFLYAQLEMLDTISARRRRLFETYYHHLQPLEAHGLLRLPHIPEDCVSNYHLFYILLSNIDTRNVLMTHLQQHNIHAVFHYVPLHSSPMGRKFGYRASDLPITEELSGCLLRLPFYYDLTEEEQLRVVKYVTEFIEHPPTKV
jgi:dTDP-4-amino-4,6-dideoxygalactose transaminase